MSTLGLIAGGGRFPIILAELAKKEKYNIVGIGIENQTDYLFGKHVKKIHWIKLTEIEKLITILKSEGINKVIMAGKINKTSILNNFKPDKLTSDILSRLPDQKDETLLKALVKLLEKEGISVENSFLTFSSLMPKPGVLTSRAPADSEMDDIKFGYPIAKSISGLDIGQTIVVKKKMVLAVESIEGTDETIKRAGKLGGEGNVVIKVSRPAQDLRFDLPVIGIETINIMKITKSSCLAIEANESILLDKEKTIKKADENNISIVAVDAKLMRNLEYGA